MAPPHVTIRVAGLWTNQENPVHQQFTALIGSSAGEFRAKKHGKGPRRFGQATLPISLEFRQYDSFLCLVFSFTVGIAGFAEFVRLQENDLTETFVGVYTRRQGSSVRDFEGDEAFPLRLKRSHVDDDAATRVGALAYTDSQYA